MINTLIALRHYRNVSKTHSLKYASGQVSDVLREAMMFLLIVFIIDIFILVWAMSLVKKCASKSERTLHYILAFFFPLFYIIYAYASGCAGKK